MWKNDETEFTEYNSTEKNENGQAKKIGNVQIINKKIFQNN